MAKKGFEWAGELNTSEGGNKECYFQTRPKQQMIFENAMLHPPKHLTERIRQLREPVREINRKFIRRLIEKMHLRQDIDPQKAERYLESIEYYLQSNYAALSLRLHRR